MKYFQIYLVIFVIIGINLWQTNSFQLPVRTRTCAQVDSSLVGNTTICEVCIEVQDVGRYIETICNAKNLDYLFQKRKQFGLFHVSISPFGQVYRSKCMNLKNIITSAAPLGIAATINSLTETKSPKRGSEICVSVKATNYMDP